MSDLQTLVAQEVKRQVASLLAADATVKKVLNYLKSSGGGGLPLGHLFAWPFQTPPDGAIQCNGAEYNRALYADFFAHASSKGWVKTEAEWQQIASANGGFCPWYSDGDGSTTFRTPKFAPFMQVAIASSSVGSYHQAGLPDHVHAFLYVQGWGQGSDGTPRMHPKNTSSTWVSQNTELASGSNPIYGRTDTVQPESNEWMICVVVAGQATNLGSVDVANVLGAVAQVQADVSTKVDASLPHVIDKGESGEIGWRVWSDGLIEQWLNSSSGDLKLNTQNKTFTFVKPYSNDRYALVGVGVQIENTAAQNVAKTATGFTTSSVTRDFGTGGWYAFGY